jgi:uncharacterized protein
MNMGFFKVSLAGLVLLLSVSNFAFSADDLRLVQAVQNKNMEVVRALLDQKVDVKARQGDGATALHWAVRWDDLETADLLIRAGSDVNAQNDLGITPLSLACTNRSAAMVQRLLQAGANPNAVQKNGETVLMTCASTGGIDAVKSLLSHGTDVNVREGRGQTALMWAVAEKHPDVAAVLVEKGADVSARSDGGFTPLLFAAQQGDTESARKLLDAGANVDEAAPDGMTPLLMASASGHETLAILLLERGANPNAVDKRGVTALHYALQKGLSTIAGVRISSLFSYLFRPNMTELIRALLAKGADPNARISTDPHWYDDGPNMRVEGATPFLLAAASYDANVMRLLAENGADRSIMTDEGVTPLMVAAGAGRRGQQTRTEEEEKRALEAVKLAVELGADVNAANVRGQTALHIAAYMGSDTIIQFLVEREARVNAKDKFGQTPLSIAQNLITVGLGDDSPRRPREFHKETSELLIKLGAVPLDPAEISSGELQ